MLQQIDLPTDQYKAIIRFAALLGIPEQRFTDFCQQQNNITKTQNS
jgi:plasmid maintenance system antidote protein VapI